MAKKKISPSKAVAAIQALHDVLYRESDGTYSADKECGEDAMETIRAIVDTVIPAPETCEGCGHSPALCICQRVED